VTGGGGAEVEGTLSRLAKATLCLRTMEAGPLESERILENSAAILIKLNLPHNVRRLEMWITGAFNHSGRCG
jgi:predicted dinucleotide-binding enzyme